jgi:glycyl-tRNA synthetase
MQDVLLRLQEFWTGQGCLIAQPMNTEVGAGTMNPATYLRVLGPEPWRVAYVEPSVRPDDARYGENPNRLQMYDQYQVILKPEPGDAQQLYLRSLAALGVDIAGHDIRFVEDDWAQPALGAWGLGWEVWLDGLEITQFTYFQQAGGQALDPVPVEITYGVERIVMALQGVRHFRDIAYAPGVSYGEIFGQGEYEMSRYYLDEADIETNRQLFELTEAEARRLIAARLPLPAHTAVLRCSHLFNVLDARGAIGATERAGTFARMRELAQAVSRLWVERRAELGHPLGLAPEPVAPELPALPEAPRAAAALVLEIGVEELPASEVIAAPVLLRRLLSERLDATRLGHGQVTTMATPRRIVAMVEEVEPRERDQRRQVRGPRVSAAFAGDGEPTPAGRGFARSQGLGVEQLERVTIGGQEFVAATTESVGRSATEVLAGILPEVVRGMRSDKNMRWAAPGLTYSRPIRWVLALLGDRTLPFAVSTLASGYASRIRGDGLERVVEVASAGAYRKTMAGEGVVLDFASRRDGVVTQARALAGGAGGRLDEDGDAGLIDQVANLVERPHGILGAFEERHLALPQEVLVTVMEKHQRYLPLRGADGALLPRFVAFADGDCDDDLVRAGNEAVLRARYEDAAFFHTQDLKRTPDELREGLSKLVFHERLGSMADRSGRIAALALELADGLGLESGERATLERAAALARFDLASQMVIELSSLAGVMARDYALRAGETPAVADALFEIELPRNAGDSLPRTLPGALLAVADRLDALAGLFAVGAAPTGSSDPFALRRAALGLTAILRTLPALASIAIPEALAAAAAHQPVEAPIGVLDDAAEFTYRRFEQYLADAGHPSQVVKAVRPLMRWPRRAEAAAGELDRLLDEPRFRELVRVLQRTHRILPAGTPAGFDAAALAEPAERDLARTLAEAEERLRGRAGDLAAFAAEAAALVPAIDAFFEAILVMAEDPEVRRNRLGLLAAVDRLAWGFLDWQAIERAPEPAGT